MSFHRQSLRRLARVVVALCFATIQSSAASGFAAYYAGADGADDDGDGTANLIELAAGRNPEAVEAGAPRPLWLEPVAGGWSLHLSRLHDLGAVGVRLILQFSSDLDHWIDAEEPGAPALTETVVASRDSTGPVTGVVDDVKIDVAGWSAEKLFVRASAEAITPPDGSVIYINHETGDDGWTGTSPAAAGPDGPVRTFAKAVTLLAPGMTLNIQPTAEPYREALPLQVSGTVDQPIVVEGNGAVIELGQDKSEGPWREEDGLWVLDDVVWPTSISGQKQRAFAFLSGQPICRPRTTIAAGELPPVFTALPDGAGKLHFRFPDGMTPPFTGFYIVDTQDNCVPSVAVAHVRVHDLNVVGAGDDGFGFQGACMDLIFENCSSILCGDEAMSAHGAGAEDSAEFRDSVFGWCGSYAGGVAHGQQASTKLVHCLSAFNRGAGYDLSNGSVQTLIDCFSIGNTVQQSNQNLPPATVEVVNLVELRASAHLVADLEVRRAGEPLIDRLLKIGAARGLVPVATNQP